MDSAGTCKSGFITGLRETRFDKRQTVDQYRRDRQQKLV